MRGTYNTIADPGLLVGGKARSGGLRIVDYGGVIQAFPSFANCVVIGSVRKAAAFVSQDRTSVYSDFTIEVESILKQDRLQPVAETSQVIGDRQGGSIRFPSGHITDFMVRGEGYPAVGARYVFFLARWEDQVGHYNISTAYQLNGGKVYPIDDRRPYTDYEGVPEEQFLQSVRSAIASDGR